MSNKTFHIGITMAGAISAGAYTGGVLDYLFETLEKWQIAKDHNKEILTSFPTDFVKNGYDLSIPMHNVVIDVMSGASAGGITAVIATMGLMEGIDPYNEKRRLSLKELQEEAGFTIKKEMESWRNKLYDCWVNMADEDNYLTTFKKLLDTTDLKGKSEVNSILNSNVIEEIGVKASTLAEVKDKLPKYMSEELDIILSVSNLRGLKFIIDFEGNGSDKGTSITMHGGFFKYRIVPQENVAILQPNSFEETYHIPNFKHQVDLERLIKASRSTGAFPFGFAPIKNNILSEKVKKYSDELFGNIEGINLAQKNWGKKYEFLSVDGGMINNEPFGCAYQSLDSKLKDIKNKSNYAIIMIDPFPSYDNDKEFNNEKRDLITTAKNIINALRNQVMFNQEDILDAISESNNKRFLIAPRRKVKSAVQNYPIACGALGGFSGFIAKSFREHDFRLGRKNCKDFLRYHFALEQSHANITLGNWNKEAKDRFKYFLPRKVVGGTVYLPIIPDMDVEIAWNQSYPKNETFSFPKMNLNYLDQFKNPIKRRINRLFWNFIPNIQGKTWREKIGNLIIIGYLSFGFVFARKIIRKKLLNIIVEDLDKIGLLK